MKINIFKKIALGSVLAISTCLAMVSQVNAAAYNTTHYGMNVNNGSLSKLNLTKKEKSQIQAIQKSNHNNGKNGYKNNYAAISKVLTVSQRNQLEKMRAANRVHRGPQNGHNQGKYNQNHNYNYNYNRHR
ncbi:MULTISPECIES: hypothetical protein [unclassified Psychrobacter]|uniref:hypothetical protein n=1 Tax=unclassified Psychrobacter TaxID=196806 RepID=UPI0025D65B0A|nr:MULTISPECIES: hypothetical protein [unclassified Psychrobacter]